SAAIFGFFSAAAYAVSAAVRQRAENAGSKVFQRRAACAAAAARFSVAAVLTGRRKRLMSSLSGAVGIADHFSPCIFWWTIPAIGLPAGTCILSSASSPK